MAKQIKRIGRRHSDDFHPRAPRGFDAKQGVFKHDTVFRRHAQKRSGLQKDIGRGLAVDNIVRANDCIEELTQSG